MSIDDALRAKVRGLVTEYLGRSDVPADLVTQPIAIRSGTAVVYLRLIASEPPLVRVFSPLLRRLPRTPELLTELNELNGRLNFIRLFWRDDSVIAAAEMLASTLDPIELSNACDWVADTADYYDERLRDQFGGQLAFDPPATAS
ncbi:T3SS (YopN, CesT) and YbjN peptide-binding chaperone 1 [Dactylosporangium sp. CA-233914]|uniref:T3SS (YopN, CesT) and YbjN peptide-binding chaperone 1 n=1 Tax=Dactylosporangium sp. CA-233914 TaxID=3239934 RepID=UPI003D8BC936